MKKKRVVVTGVGGVTCFGTDMDIFYKNLLEGKSGISMIDTFDCSEFPTRFAGVVQDFETGDYMDKKQARRVDPFIRYVMVAGKKALEDAKLTKNAKEIKDKNRAGIIIGSGMGGMSVFYDGANTLMQKNFRRLTPFFVPYIITNMGGALLAIDLGFKGPNYSISTACATSNYCIAAAAEQIQSGHADLMLCGGAEAPINPIGVAGFVAIKALSTRNEDPQKASRPWDKTRDGFVIGEGCGVLVLESLDHALQRGAPIYAEYLAGTTNCDAYHMTDPKEDGQGVTQCIQTVLQQADVQKEDVSYINAHATSTLVGDLCEISAMQAVFGDHLKKVKINATKSMIGHCLGAAGGLEAIATVKAIQTGMIHPTINVKDPEQAVSELDIVAGKAQQHTINSVALSSSFGFGGHNSVLAFAPYKK